MTKQPNKPSAQLNATRPPTEAALGAINYDNSVLLKRPEYAVQCNPDALQDGAYHNHGLLVIATVANTNTAIAQIRGRRVSE